MKHDARLLLPGARDFYGRERGRGNEWLQGNSACRTWPSHCAEVATAQTKPLEAKPESRDGNGAPRLLWILSCQRREGDSVLCEDRPGKVTTLQWKTSLSRTGNTRCFEGFKGGEKRSKIGWVGSKSGWWIWLKYIIWSCLMTDKNFKRHSRNHSCQFWIDAFGALTRFSTLFVSHYSVWRHSREGPIQQHGGETAASGAAVNGWTMRK